LQRFSKDLLDLVDEHAGIALDAQNRALAGQLAAEAFADIAPTD
jgi:hypothetical protein